MSNLIDSVFISLLKRLFRFWVSGVKGIENIPEFAPAVIVFNHQSYFDFLCFTAVLPRPIRFLAAEKLFTHPTLSWLMRLTNQIKVERFVDNKKSAIAEAKQTLIRGELLGIFPEGSRSRSGEIQRAFDGAVRIAIEMGVPIIPVGIIGTFNILPPHRKIPQLKRCQIVIGKPINLNNLGRNKYDTTLIRDVTSHVMHQVADLSEKQYTWGPRKSFHSVFRNYDNTKVAIFDLDNTVIKGQSQFEYIKYLYSKKIISKIKILSIASFFLLYKSHLLPVTDQLRERLYSFFKGYNYEKLENECKNFYNDVLAKTIYSEARHEVKKCLSEGYECILCSASWKPIVDTVARGLGIQHVLATKLEKINGIISGRLLGDSVYGINKQNMVISYCRARNLNLSQSRAYADHVTDIPLLHLVQEAYAVNPDRGVIKEAKFHKWPILHWMNT